MKNVKLVLTLMIALIFSAAMYAQDTVSEKKQKTFKIQLTQDEDGETITIDTLIVIDEDFDAEEFEAYMSKFKDKMKNMEFHLKGLTLHEDQLKDMEENLHEMEIHLEGMDFDSKNFYSGHPGSSGFNWTSDCCDKDIRKWNTKKGESLSDVLGDIPMSAVKSYKVKETKYGKKIVIEVNDEYPDHISDGVFIISKSHAPRRHVRSPNVKHEYIIQTSSDGDDEVEVEVILEEIEE